MTTQELMLLLQYHMLAHGDSEIVMHQLQTDARDLGAGFYRLTGFKSIQKTGPEVVQGFERPQSYAELLFDLDQGPIDLREPNHD